MKTLVIGIIAVGGALALSAGSASAASSWQCKQYAQQVASQYGGNPGASAAAGGIFGGLLGAGIAGATGGNVGTGAAIGAGVGVVGGLASSGPAYQDAYNQAYWDCMNQPGPQPVYGGGGYGPPAGSEDWYQACAAKYKSFQWNGPYAGSFKGYDGQWHQCQL